MMTTGERNEFDGKDKPTFDEMRKFYRENFNTQLSPEEEFRFHDWADSVGKRIKTDLMEWLDDYDLRGAFKEGACFDDEAAEMHFPSKFKKPNNLTFATDSIYHGAVDLHHGGTYEAGEMGVLQDGTPTFSPSKKMLETTHPRQWVEAKFRTDAPEFELFLPKEAGGVEA